jgi:hypothetical protein
MTIAHTPPRLTRVVIDDSCVEIAQLELVAERIHELLPAGSAQERDYIANALLNLGFGRCIEAKQTRSRA